MSTELQRQIAFSRIKNLQLKQAHEILERVGGVDGFFDSSTRDLWQKIGSQQSFCTDASRDALLKIGAAEERFCVNSHAGALFMDSDDFPKRLKECDDAPSLLYVLGNCDLNSSHVISIVGTRKATAYGQKFTTDLVNGLAERLDNPVIVSGLAYGIDVSAHKAALQAKIPTVAVVAHGLRTIYPADHRDIAARIVRSGGAILTEYPSDAPIHRGNFLARNRIVAGMSDITVIVESEEKGGAMVTASIAFAYNREVGAAPGRAIDRYSAGPNKLIVANRAALIRNADDIIELLNWTPKAAAVPQQRIQFKKTLDSLGPEQRKIIDCLRSVPRASVNDLVEATGIPYSTLSARLMELEMDDIVQALPGAAYSLNI